MSRVAPRARWSWSALVCVVALATSAWAGAPASASAPGEAPHDCHVDGLRNGVVCGVVAQPLDPAHPESGRIDIRYVVVPALARRKLDDPVFFIAGGPGQSAIATASAVMPLLSRLNNRRDLVFVDQRGTGESSPLQCPDTSHDSLAEQADPARQAAFALRCKAMLAARPGFGGERALTFFTTTIAVQDLEAVRRALGTERVDVVAASYGTRVALEWLRQNPSAIRRSVLDGVAPPDMALPASFSTDAQSAFASLVAACKAQAPCARRHPDLGARFAELLRSLPRRVSARNPRSGREETFVATRELVLGATRSALYSPVLASALPAAIDAAAAGDMSGLLGLGSAYADKPSTRLAFGMHLAVVCSEDVPLLGASSDLPGADFGDEAERSYRRLCAGWPRGEVPKAFYSMSVARSPVLLLSGGIDPATPPRHAERVAKALGPMARAVVVAAAGHGVMSIGCMRDVVFRFIDAATDAAALAVDADCAASIPRPDSFELPGLVDGGAKASR